MPARSEPPPRPPIAPAGPITVCYTALAAPGARSGVIVDPIAFLRLAPPGAPVFYWAAPDDSDVVAAYGATHVAQAAGVGRWNALHGQIASAAARLQPAAASRSAGGAPTGVDAPPVRWLGGFAFDDRVDDTGVWARFPALWFVLPAVTLTVRDGQAWLTLTAASDADTLPAEADAIADRMRAMTATSAEDKYDILDPDVQHGRANTGDTDPDLVGRIARVVDAIRRGEADKVVLATTHSLQVPTARDPLAVLARLRARQSDCFHFLVAPGDSSQPSTARRPGLRGRASQTLSRLQSPGDLPPGDHPPGNHPPAENPPLSTSPLESLAPPTFLGATPERLVRVEGEHVWTMALAGTARRGADPAGDADIGAMLLASVKDCGEHDWVVRAIVDALVDLDVAVDPVDSPRLRRLATMQHLETPIHGRWRGGRGDISRAAARLHPTPALGGTPRVAALRLIRDTESFDRGWYGGGVGWVDGRGDGDLAVAIRSVLLRGDVATAFAGAGLVAASDPAAEAREIALKLGAALAGV